VGDERLVDLLPQVMAHHDIDENGRNGDDRRDDERSDERQPKSKRQGSRRT
jgi:hypothetical protein